MITIREAQPADIPFIIDFQKKMAHETEHLTLDGETLSRGVNQLIRDPRKGKYYVAEESGTVIGCLMTTFEWSDWRDGTVLWIQSVYISKDFRGKGVYRKMYDHIREIVSLDPALKGVRLYVDRNNTEAQSVYKKLGMDGEHYSVFEWMKGDRN